MSMKEGDQLVVFVISWAIAASAALLGDERERRDQTAVNDSDSLSAAAL